MSLEHTASPVAWYRKLMKVRPPAGPTAPAAAIDRERALARLRELSDLDEGIPEATRTRLYEPDADTDTTIVFWHGFTNAPSQFSQAGEALRGLGYRVLVPRLPHHGQSDLLTKDLAGLTVAELTAQVDACIDIAAGLGPKVWVVGLSAGGTMAAWAAATRPEVSRVLLLAPLVAPKGFPLPLVRAMVKWPAIVPKFYMWWDPRAKADLVKDQSPYAYPGFPVPGLFPFLHLSEALFDHSVTPDHDLERLVLVSNPGDLAIRRDSARDFTFGVFGPRAAMAGEAMVDGNLKWMHDFVDPWGSQTGTTEQVVAILLAGLGVGEPTAGGVLVPPLLTEQPSA
ncbi:MAG: alpha/beta fold hydrolase [Propionicimonas sp.]